MLKYITFILGEYVLNHKIKEQNKLESLFNFWDLAVYLALAVLLILLFVCFVITPKNKTVSGFKVYIDGKEILRYEYSLGKLEIVNDDYQNLIVQDGNKITIFTDEHKDKFNTLEIDTDDYYVKVVQANCSTSKECVHTPAITTNTNAIVCAKHKLKIVPLSWSNQTPPQSGGVK